MYPVELRALFMEDTQESRGFLSNIRTYNNSLATASMNCNVDSHLLGLHPYCFRIHGQVYHLSSTLHPPEDRVPNYNQIYFFDAERAIDERNRQADKYRLDRGLLFRLHQLMENINPYARSFKMMGQVEREEQERARRHGNQPRNLYMHIRADRDLDLRRYNSVNANEVAAVFTTEDGFPPSCLQYEIVIHPRVGAQIQANFGAISSDGLFRIQRMNPNCEPMTYPILFPQGQRGYRDNIPHVTARGRERDKTTPLQYYSFKFQLRAPVFPIFQLARKLFLQYIVDCYTKIEGHRLDFLKNHQADLRVDLYSGLQDSIHQNGIDINSPDHDPNRRTGRRFILPSSFPGSPRAMQQNFQDAMAIVREFGKPDLFITFTCNPSWPEITENLLLTILLIKQQQTDLI